MSVGGTQAVMMVSSVAMGMMMRFSQVMDGVRRMGMIVGIVRTMKVVVGMIVAFDQIAAANNISPAIVAVGIKVALLTTVFGVRSVDPRLFEAASMLGASSSAMFPKVVLPAALPSR